MAVGVLVISSKVLLGQVLDTNSVYVCKQPASNVSKVVTVKSEVKQVAGEVARLSTECDVVLMSGGLTAACQALQQLQQSSANVAPNRTLLQLYHTFFNKELVIPSNCKLFFIPPSIKSPAWVPVVQVTNIYSLPGAPELFETAAALLLASCSYYLIGVQINMSPCDVVSLIKKAAGRLGTCVLFGVHMENDCVMTLVMRGANVDHLVAARSLVATQVTSNFNWLQAAPVYELCDQPNSLAASIHHALQVIEEAFKRYKGENILISFNGGKDATVLLHLVWVVRQRLSITTTFTAMYVRSEDAFQQVDQFTAATAKLYGLQLITLTGPMKEEFTKLASGHPNLQAVFLGTRRSDPYSNTLTDFAMCDRGWPQVMRVCPLLDWSYSHVWTFLRLLGVPYCKLYDQGYTSLGNVSNTAPNPALLDSASGSYYLPAYTLEDGSQERSGRR